MEKLVVGVPIGQTEIYLPLQKGLLTWLNSSIQCNIACAWRIKTASGLMGLYSMALAFPNHYNTVKGRVEIQNKLDRLPVPQIWVQIPGLGFVLIPYYIRIRVPGIMRGSLEGLTFSFVADC